MWQSAEDAAAAAPDCSAEMQGLIDEMRKNLDHFILIEMFRGTRFRFYSICHLQGSV